MSSCLSGGRAAYGFDLDIVVKNSSSSPASSSSRSTHSSPSSTLSESSNSPLAISTKRARAPRKRPNQTYNEAAALLSTAYPGVFSAKSIPKLCRNNSNRPFNSSSAAAESPAELLIPPFPALGDAGFLLHQYVADEPSPRVELRPTSSSERSCLSPVEFREPSSPAAGLDDDFDAESILDEEVGEGIDSIMGNLTVDANDGGGGANAYLGSAAMGHGFGRMFKFGYGGNMRRALRKTDDGEWWRSPTVEVLKIAPKLKPAPAPAPPAADKKKKKVQKVEKVLDRASKLEQKAEAAVPPPDKAEAAAASSPEQQPEAGKMKPVLSLKLDYEDVMKAWSGHASPFSVDAGDSPESRADTIARLSQVELFPEGLREASVLRYKEKRRTRLFSKKIRYQVRKVNADCRPRMKRRARFSFMGSKGGPLWKQMTFWLSDQSNKAAKGGGYLSTRNANGEKKTIFLNDGFLDFLDKELQSFQYDKEDYQALPFDFCGGFVGYIGYGLKVECGASSNRHKSMVPDACFFFADNLLVIDHSNDDVYILSIHDTQCRRSSAAQHDTSQMKNWLDETEKKLLGLVSSPDKMFIKHKLSTCPSNLSKPKFVVEKSRCQYMKDVESCLKFIQDGESYELCLTTQMKMRVKDIDAFGTYCTLRERNPAPYAAWLNFSKENLSILCSSPERFLQLDRNGILEAKPIKGTIARGATMEEDDHLKFQLQHSEKDQAENLMIVDLLRNDLGRVCEPGTVHVPHLMKVESYATVHTMVSTIRGEKIADLSPIDCVRAAFPGGSMTGAPKLRSMELLDTIECCSRGVYSGSIGFFSYNQRFDLNIVIRTVVIHEGEASIGAGGAVVALSSPEDEYEEMLLKARAPARVVEEYSKEVVSEKSLTSSSFHSGLCEREPLPLD